MRTTNLAASASKLQQSLKSLRTHWEETKLQWNDPVQRDFEARQLLPLEQRVEATVRAIDELREVLNRMVREVGPRDED